MIDDNLASIMYKVGYNSFTTNASFGRKDAMYSLFYIDKKKQNLIGFWIENWENLAQNWETSVKYSTNTEIDEKLRKLIKKKQSENLQNWLSRER